MRRLLVAAAVTSCVFGVATPSSAQAKRYALLVEGASGEEQYSVLHRGWLDRMAASLKDDMKFDPANIVVLAEKPGPGEERSTADNLRAAFATVAGQVSQDDLFFVMLIGHGSGQGADAKFNLIGRDLNVSDWSALVSSVPARVVFVDATSASFPYVAGLSGAGRVVITATNSYAQRFHTQFAGAFIESLTAEEADADKNGRISLLEAFDHASRLVAQHYEQNGTMATENAVLEDTGDGTGRIADGEGPDGDLAALTYLDVVELPTSSDSGVQQLIRQQAALTAQIDELRRNRNMIGEAAFEQRFETLIIELALVSREVRRRTGG